MIQDVNDLFIQTGSSLQRFMRRSAATSAGS